VTNLCECCGERIERGFGKVCEKCEKKVLKKMFLRESKKAMDNYLKRTKEDKNDN